MAINRKRAGPVRKESRIGGSIPSSDAATKSPQIATATVLTASQDAIAIAGQDVTSAVDTEALIAGAKRRAKAEHEKNLRRGEPRLTVTQSRLLTRLLQFGESGAHAYGLAQELDIKEDTVRSALASLMRKGLIENGTFVPSDVGPMRSLYRVVDRQCATRAVEAENQRRAQEIERLSRHLAKLIKA